jgi:hypothetical protein
MGDVLIDGKTTGKENIFMVAFSYKIFCFMHLSSHPG